MSDEINEKIKIFDENYPIIKENIRKICAETGRNPDDVILLAATKTVEPEVINHAINSGLKYIGENRVQEFISKNNIISANVHRHFIGHLQTNKVSDIVPLVEMIHSVHSVKLAAKIGKVSLEIGKKTDILLEVNIGKEESKSGFYPEEISSSIDEISKIDGIHIKGLMAIPPICGEKEISQYFSQMQKLFIDNRIKNSDNVSMVYLSMGMSDDYRFALRNGANIIRRGSAPFGKRNYNV